MGVIKANHAPPAAAAFSLADIEQYARTMLARAQAQADQILAAAKQEADAMRAAASKEGRATGLAQGQKEGREQAIAAAKTQALTDEKAKLAEAIKTFQSAAMTVEAKLNAIQQAAQNEVIRLAIAISRRVTRNVADANPAVAEANVREAVRLATSKASVRIAISPSQREALSALLPQLKLQWPAMQHVELVDDATLSPGGCRVFTVAGEIDADLGRQLDRIEAELLPNAGAGSSPEARAAE